MNILIYYFSGTGNSKRIADVAAEGFKQQGHSAQVKSIEDGQLDPQHLSAEIHGFVFPVYFWGIPRIMEKFMHTLPPASGKKSFLLLTAGNVYAKSLTLNQARKILEKKGYAMLGGDTIAMPDSFIVVYDPPPVDKATFKVKAAEGAAAAFAKKILSGEPKIQKSSFSEIIMRFMYVFYRTVIKFHIFWPGFRVDNKCNSCEICAKICPVKNIQMVGGKPTWGKHCEACMRCIQLCPQKAIQTYFGSEKKNRYKEPHLEIKDLIN
ncbi:MAG: EFR1 family ferrodoxin [Candidatus Margulisbacteria bacterium]|nr:EFR1 family ferrodoxin [Candidatus Margulisiibacteriota bacterium]MBU1021147.1 EFR1 family ferrodoxin [Candidatus Margulisiibacteriota bacterium]MBU1729753.1 EFR1 family ferrodoxin [Candidatus Margulisiibacteriota bacterium]MBU1955254.1 EFR1 family ferrodoxin [Candidatus Margulisiibacteriota bacterium]